MSEEIWYELNLLGHSFLLGIWFLIVYDGFRLFRQIVPHHTLAVGLEDIGYWVYAAVRLFTLLYYENDGNLRAYAIAGVFAGMILYNLTISLFFRKVLKKIRKSIKMKKKEKMMKEKRKTRETKEAEGRKKQKNNRNEKQKNKRNEETKNGRNEKQKGPKIEGKSIEGKR